MPQHLAALEKANRHRFAAAEIRRELFEGRITAAEALYDERAQSLTIERLLASQYRWGPQRAARLLRRLDSPIPVHENRRVRDLTERQRTLLVEALRP